MSRTDIVKMFAPQRAAAILTGLALLISGRSALADELVSAPRLDTLAQVQSVLLDLQQVPIDMTPSQTEIETGAAITEATTSATTFTSPSLWWQQDQASLLADNHQMVSGWVAYRRDSIDSMHHIDLALNRQLWNSLNYIEQYALISQFGQTAKSYGYQLRLFTGEILAGAYVCNFNPAVEAATLEVGSKGNFSTVTHHKSEISPASVDDIPCAVSLDYLGRGSIRGSGTNLFGQP